MRVCVCVCVCSHHLLPVYVCVRLFVPEVVTGVCSDDTHQHTLTGERWQRAAREHARTFDIAFFLLLLSKTARHVTLRHHVRAKFKQSVLSSPIVSNDKTQTNLRCNRDHQGSIRHLV